MEVKELLAELERRGVALWQGGQGQDQRSLKYALVSALTPELVDELRRHKGEILAQLSAQAEGLKEEEDGGYRTEGDLSTDPRVHKKRGATAEEAQLWADYDRMVFRTMERLRAASEAGR